MTEMQDKELLRKIDDRIGIESINKFERIDIGYSNLVFNINDKYILKVCTKPDNEVPITNEINFYKFSSFDFHPKLISFDTSKTTIPNIFVLLEKASGVNLSNVWGKLSETERQAVIAKITIILKSLHSIKIDYPEFITDFNAMIERYILDFEYSSISLVDREFDAINRMCQDPLSIIQKGNTTPINLSDYKNIMGCFRETYPEVFKNENVNYRLLIYNCANALRWSVLYPDFSLCRDILFEKSKVLLKR